MFGRRSKNQAAGDSEASYLTDELWAIVVDSVVAASRGRADRWRRALNRLEEIPNDERAGFVVAACLNAKSSHLAGQTGMTIDALSESHGEDFRRVTGYSAYWLRRTLKTVDGLKLDGVEIRGWTLIALGTAALGVLCEDPRGDLAEMRMPMAKLIDRTWPLVQQMKGGSENE